MSAPYYFLGGYFKRVKYPNTNSDVLTWGSKTYVKRMMDTFKNTFGFDPSKQHSVMPLNTSLGCTPLSYALILRRRNTGNA